MVSYRVLLAVICLLCAGLVDARPGRLRPNPWPRPSHKPIPWPGSWSARAASTSFAELEAFGKRAATRDDREGLNRLYHVTWTILNQGEFDRAAAWNTRLAEAARVQKDDRYIDIAALNALTIRYDKGDVGAASEMAYYAANGRDWFVRAHAARLTALNLVDQGRIGEGLRLLADAQADIPERDPFAATARAGIWEVVGMALKDIDDVQGATEAFRKFEIDHSNPGLSAPGFRQPVQPDQDGCPHGRSGAGARSRRRTMPSRHGPTFPPWPFSTPPCAPWSPTPADSRPGFWPAWIPMAKTSATPPS